MENAEIIVNEETGYLNIDIDKNQWDSGAIEDIILQNNNGLYIENKRNIKAKVQYKQDILVEDAKKICLQTRIKERNPKNGGINIRINGWSVPSNGIAEMPLLPPVKLVIEIEINADSSAVLEEMQLLFREEMTDAVENCSNDCDILVVSPSYPSSDNLYLAAFAHSRNKIYAENGLKIQVAALNENNWYQTQYVFEGIPVITGKPKLLKSLLNKKQYKVIIVHFADVEFYRIFEDAVTDEKLIFICHGPETSFNLLTKVVHPYFEAPTANNEETNILKRHYVEKYSWKENVYWIFVSQWLKDASEENLKIRFRNAYSIGNVIDEQLFPYVQKGIEDRKKILVLRKFDNIAYHSLDIVMRAILIMSQKEYFKELQFDIYGDGNFYEQLTSPIKNFENVHLHRTFVKNSEIADLHKTHGVMLIPSRHDSQGVSMGEAASSGVVPLGSKVTCLSYFMDDKNNHILSDPENPYALVDNFERLYYNPDEYLRISRELSAYVQQLCGREQTIYREVRLIRNVYGAWTDEISALRKREYVPSKKPILTVIVFLRESESEAKHCLWTLVNHNNAEKCEIILVDDCQTAEMLEVGHAYEKATNGVIKVAEYKSEEKLSAAEKGIILAEGKYIKFMDSHTWVDSDNFSKFIDVLMAGDSDLYLTKCSYKEKDEDIKEHTIAYDFLSQSVQYRWSDLQYPLYGFGNTVPLLENCTYRTAIFKQEDLQMPDSETDIGKWIWKQKLIDTVEYCGLEVCRHLGK